MEFNASNKIYLLGDLHYGTDSNSVTWLNHQTNFINDVLIPHIVKTMNPGDVLFQFGDVFDTKQTVNVKVYNTVRSLFIKLGSILPVYTIIGNHDTYYVDNNDTNSLKAFSDIDNVTVFETPEVIQFGDNRVLILPWITDFNSLASVLESNVGKAEYVFAHMDVMNMQYDNGYPIMKGIDRAIIKDYRMVISGHIHKPQSIDNFHYIGMPYHLDFGDVGQTRGFYELFFASQARQYDNLNFIKNDTSPTFKYIDVFDLFEMRDADITRECENSFIKIQGPDSVIKSIQKDSIKEYVTGLVKNLHRFDFDGYPDVVGKDPVILNFKLDIPELAKETLTSRGLYNTAQVNDITALFKELYESAILKMKHYDGEAGANAKTR